MLEWLHVLQMFTVSQCHHDLSWDSWSSFKLFVAISEDPVERAVDTGRSSGAQCSGITGCGHRPASVRYLSQTIFTHNSPSPFGLDQTRVDSSRSDDLSSNISCVVVGEMSGCRLYFPRGGLVAETFYNTENMWNMKETRENKCVWTRISKSWPLHQYWFGYCCRNV